ncbi:MAG: hypothetical protein IJ736_09205 [Firmicutes bacterium]|nr:hypothetical protein [Bacillota bacterium]
MNHKKTIIVGFWTVAAVIVLIIMGSVIKSITEDDSREKIYVYFLNPISNELIAEEHLIDTTD